VRIREDRGSAQDRSVVTEGEDDATKAEFPVAASIRGFSGGMAGFMGAQHRDSL
jgi:hypothetical protein